MNTNEQIFPLYVGNENVMVKYLIDGKEGYQYDYYDQWLGDGSGEFMPDVMMYCGDVVQISDCQLILKRISEMSDQTEIVEHDLLTGKIIHLSRQPKVIFEDLQQAINEHIFWLIEHGYALSDEWFTNGIAVEAGK